MFSVSYCHEKNLQECNVNSKQEIQKKRGMNMKSFSASPDTSEVWASICSPQEEKLAKRKQIYSKEFQEMLDKLDHEELGEDDPEEEGLLGFGGGEKKRRLSVDQVKALERSFEKDNKLEPERKNRLAEELVLQPRQVAIWFQNRRARGKSKQLERDYGVLKSDYDSLRAGYDYLNQEKKSLVSQLTELKMKLKQQVRVDENDLDRDRRVGAEEECPVSESVVIVKTQFGYGSEIDASSNSDDCSDALVKEEILEEEEPNLFKPEVVAVMPMSSPGSVSSLYHNNTSTASSGSSCTTSMLSWFQGWDSRGPTLGAAGKAAYVHTYPRVVTDEPQHGWLNFFSVDHSPTLHCYFAEDDEK